MIDNTVTIDGTTYEFVVSDRRPDVAIGGSPSERAESLARLAEIIKAWDEAYGRKDNL